MLIVIGMDCSEKIFKKDHSNSDLSKTHIETQRQLRLSFLFNRKYQSE